MRTLPAALAPFLRRGEEGWTIDLQARASGWQLVRMPGDWVSPLRALDESLDGDTVVEATLAGASLGPEGLSVLAETAWFAGLRRLDLSWTNIDGTVFDLIDRCTALEALNVSRNAIDGATLAAFIERGGARRLKKLGIGHTGVGPIGWSALSGAKLDALRMLFVDGLQLTDDDLPKLFDEAWSKRLDNVDLSENRLGDSAVEHLDRFLDRAASLWIRGNGLSPAGAKALAAAFDNDHGAERQYVGRARPQLADGDGVVFIPGPTERPKNSRFAKKPAPVADLQRPTKLRDGWWAGFVDGAVVFVDPEGHRIVPSPAIETPAGGACFELVGQEGFVVGAGVIGRVDLSTGTHDTIGQVRPTLGWIEAVDGRLLVLHATSRLDGAALDVYESNGTWSRIARLEGFVAAHLKLAAATGYPYALLGPGFGTGPVSIVELAGTPRLVGRTDGFEPLVGAEGPMLWHGKVGWLVDTKPPPP